MKILSYLWGLLSRYLEQLAQQAAEYERQKNEAEAHEAALVKAIADQGARNASLADRIKGLDAQYAELTTQADVKEANIKDILNRPTTDTRSDADVLRDPL